MSLLGFLETVFGPELLIRDLDGLHGQSLGLVELLRPDSGQVVIKGLDVWADPVAAKAVIGVVTAEAFSVVAVRR